MISVMVSSRQLIFTQAEIHTADDQSHFNGDAGSKSPAPGTVHRFETTLVLAFKMIIS